MSDATNTAPVVEEQAVETTPDLAAELEAMWAAQPGQVAAEAGPVKEAEPEALAQPVEEVKPPEENKFAHKFSAIAKKEKAILDQQRALKAQEESIKQESARTAKLAAALKKLGNDPIGALEALGVDPASLYADLTEQSITGSLRGGKRHAGPETDVLSKVREEITALKKELYTNELEKERMLGVVQARETLASDPDRWAITQSQGLEGEVWNLIEMYNAEHGKVLDFTEAADMIEQYLDGEAQKIIEATNRKQHRAAQQSPMTQPAKAAQRPTTPTTLTNSLSVKTPPSIDEAWLTTETDFEKRKQYIVAELEAQMKPK